MTGQATERGAWAAIVPGSPRQVRERLTGGCLRVRSVWFPTLAELRAWDRSTEPLYVRWTDDLRFELGPRLVNMSAARFCPVLRGELHTSPDGRTRLQARWGRNRMTSALLWIWAALLVMWMVLGVAGNQGPEGTYGWMVFWAMLAAGWAVAWATGVWWGRRELEDRLDELARIAADPSAGDDDW